MSIPAKFLPVFVFAGAFVIYVLIALLPDLQFLYIPAGILFILPSSYVCCDSCIPPEIEIATGHRFPETEGEDENSVLNNQKKTNVNRIREDSVRKGKKRKLLSKEEGNCHEEEEEIRTEHPEQEALNFSQLLYRSPTTVV